MEIVAPSYLHREAPWVFILNVVISLPPPPFLTSHPMPNAVWNLGIQTEKVHLSWPVLSTQQPHSSFLSILLLKLMKILLSPILSLLYFLSSKNVVILAGLSCLFSTISFLLNIFNSSFHKQQSRRLYIQTDEPKQKFISPTPFEFFLHQNHLLTEIVIIFKNTIP